MLEVEKRGELFVGTDNESLSVAAMCVSNPDRLPQESIAETRPKSNRLYRDCQRWFPNDSIYVERGSFS